MAGKKPGKASKKSPKAPQPAPPVPAAAAANAALMAVSTPATPEDIKKDVIFGCLVSVFDAQGFNHIKDQQSRIVWTGIDNQIIVALGDGVTNCINSKGFVCGPLAPPFQFLKDMGRVTVVGDLVTGIAELVTP